MKVLLFAAVLSAALAASFKFDDGELDQLFNQPLSELLNDDFLSDGQEKEDRSPDSFGLSEEDFDVNALHCQLLVLILFFFGNRLVPVRKAML